MSCDCHGITTQLLKRLMYGKTMQLCSIGIHHGDIALYELPAIADAIRDGRAREREIDIKKLNLRLGPV